MSTKKIKIGRSPLSEITIDERWDTVSNEHADIELRNGALVFIDHSSNGTMINNNMVHNQETGIYQGDSILLAGVYDLKWDTINYYFPQSDRPTIKKNTRLVDNELEHFKSSKLNNERVSIEKKIAENSHSHYPFEKNDHYIDNSFVQKPNNFGKENEYTQSEMDKFLEKWNWGAFFSTWIWSIFNKIYWPLLIIPISLIPYIGQVASISLSVYLGLKGSKLAWDNGNYNDFKDFVNVQNKWLFIGLSLFLVGIVINFISIFYVLEIF